MHISNTAKLCGEFWFCVKMLWIYWHIITRQISAFHKLIKCGRANINITYSVPNCFYQTRMLTEAHLLTSCICTHGNILHSLLKITLKQFMYCQMSIVSYQNAFLVIYRACLLYLCDYGCLLYYPVQYQYTYGTKGQFQAVFLYCRVYFYWSSISDFWLTLVRIHIVYKYILNMYRLPFLIYV